MAKIIDRIFKVKDDRKMLYVLIAIFVVGVILFYLALFKAAAKEDEFWEQFYEDVEKE